MLKVTIASTEVKKIVANRNKKEFSLQTGWILIAGEPHPTKFEFFLPANTGPYAKGEYFLDAEKAIVVKGGNLQVQVNLQPVVK